MGCAAGIGAVLGGAQLRDFSIRIYREADLSARTRGIIIADTKFEFGIHDDGELVLIDEILTLDCRVHRMSRIPQRISPHIGQAVRVRRVSKQSWSHASPGPRPVPVRSTKCA